MSRDDNLFKLGLKEGATRKEIDAAFRAKRIIFHPDKHQAPQDKEFARANYDSIEAAYEALIKSTPASSAPSSPVSLSNSMSPASNRPEIDRNSGLLYNTSLSLEALLIENRNKKH
jgi:hypothetical protein